MARIALGITLALLLVTCFFGWQTHSKIGGLNDEVKTASAQADSSKRDAAMAQAKLKTAQDDEATAKKDLDTAKSQVTAAQGSLDAANKQVADLQGQVKTAQDALAAATKAGSTPAPPPAGTFTKDDMDKVNAKLTDATAQIAELNQVKETLTNKAKDAQAKADDVQKQLDRINSHIMKNGLEGQVLAVNQGWNFVILSIGDHQGAVTNAEMILKRGNSEIGRVRITSVEPSTSVADIIPGSLARGVRVQPGDRVIFPGS